MPGVVQDLITPASFCEDWLTGFGVARGRILPFSVDWLYNTLALPFEFVIIVQWSVNQPTKMLGTSYSTFLLWSWPSQREVVRTGTSATSSIDVCHHGRVTYTYSQQFKLITKSAISQLRTGTFCYCH